MIINIVYGFGQTQEHLGYALKNYADGNLNLVLEAITNMENQLRVVKGQVVEEKLKKDEQD